MNPELHYLDHLQNNSISKNCSRFGKSTRFKKSSALYPSPHTAKPNFYTILVIPCTPAPATLGSGREASWGHRSRQLRLVLINTIWGSFHTRAVWPIEWVWAEMRLLLEVSRFRLKLRLTTLPHAPIRSREPSEIPNLPSRRGSKPRKVTGGVPVQVSTIWYVSTRRDPTLSPNTKTPGRSSWMPVKTCPQRWSKDPDPQPVPLSLHRRPNQHFLKPAPQRPERVKINIIRHQFAKGTWTELEVGARTGPVWFLLSVQAGGIGGKDKNRSLISPIFSKELIFGVVLRAICYYRNITQSIAEENIRNEHQWKW